MLGMPDWFSTPCNISPPSSVNNVGLLNDRTFSGKKGDLDNLKAFLNITTQDCIRGKGRRDRVSKCRLVKKPEKMTGVPSNSEKNSRTC